MPVVGPNRTISMTVTGSTELYRALLEAGDAAKAGLREGLYKEAEDILAKTIPRTPFETGDLRESGRVERSSRGPNHIRVSIVFGGGEKGIGYAFWVHENLDANHPVGQAKFLEVTATEAMSGMADRIAARVRSYVEKKAARAARAG